MKRNIVQIAGRPCQWCAPPTGLSNCTKSSHTPAGYTGHRHTLHGGYVYRTQPMRPWRRIQAAKHAARGAPHLLVENPRAQARAPDLTTEPAAPRTLAAVRRMVGSLMRPTASVWAPVSQPRSMLVGLDRCSAPGLSWQLLADASCKLKTWIHACLLVVEISSAVLSDLCAAASKGAPVEC